MLVFHMEQRYQGIAEREKERDREKITFNEFVYATELLKSQESDRNAISRSGPLV